jgi:hypothetical protein
MNWAKGRVSSFIRTVRRCVVVGSIVAALAGCARQAGTAGLASLTPSDERRLAECPAWARETVPAEVEPYLGRSGLPEPFHSQKELIGKEVTGLDLWQANHLVVYRKETARYLYSDYSPLSVHYKPGTLPAYEKIVAEHTAGLTNDRDKAVALLRMVPEKLVLHPGIVPMGPQTPKDRGLDDEALLASGRAWCNEQARVFIRLCQVAGIPARLIYLFYSPPPSGHVIAEFYADGRWSMADASYLCVFPAADGHLMSAAECHGAGKMPAGEAYFRRLQQMTTYSDERMVGAKFLPQADAAERGKRVAECAANMRKEYRAQTPKALADQLWVFGVMNYPLPE